MSQTEFVKFHVPLDTIEKGKNAAGKTVMKVAGCASTADTDHDQETLEPAGFQTDYFMSHGFINYNHQGKVLPEANIGEPTNCYVNEQGQFMVEGELYGDNTIAKSTYNTMQSLKKNGSKRKMCWSIEGKVLERDPKNPKRVTKLLVTGAALTLNPKNAATWADIAKGHLDAEILDGEVLSQVEVYARIFEQYPTLEKGMADQIFGLIEFIASPTTTPEMASTAPTIRPEHVTKAFDELKKSIGADTTGTSTRTAPGIPENPEYSEDDDDEAELLEKGMASSLELLRQGTSRQDIIKSLVEDGLAGDQAKGVYQNSAVLYAQELEAELAAEQEQDLVSKGNPGGEEPEEEEDDEDDEPTEPEPKPKAAKKPGKSDDQKKGKKPAMNVQPGQTDGIEKSFVEELFKSLGNELGGKFVAVATLLEGINERFDALDAKVETRIAAVEDTPMPRKTVPTTTSYTQRQFAGQEVEKGHGGAASGRRQVSVTQNRGEVLDLLEGRVEAAGGYENQKSPTCQAAVAAMLHFESHGQIEKSVINELQTKHGIDLIN